jgi:large subunit ribosomal protein L30
MANQLQIKLIRGRAGQPKRIKAVMKGLGLSRPHQVVVRPDTPSIRGMIVKIVHCLEVKRI